MSSRESSTATPEDDEDLSDIDDEEETENPEGAVEKPEAGGKQSEGNVLDDDSSLTGFAYRPPERFEERTPMISKSTSREISDCLHTREASEQDVVQEIASYKELFSNTFVENGPYGLGLMDALQIGVVLEEMSDKLDIIGKSIDTAEIELRTKESVDYDFAVNRPKLTIPATSDPNSNSLFREKYFLRQRYSTKAVRRIEQMCSKGSPGANFRKRLTMVLRDFGVNRYGDKGKVQSERVGMNIVLDDVAAELIQDLTFTSMVNSIDNEKEKFKTMKMKVEKSVSDKIYIAKNKKLIKKMQAERKKTKKEVQSQLWEFEDKRQELVKRKEMECAYVNHFKDMTKERTKKICTKAEREMADEMDKNKLERVCQETTHYSMLDIIYKKFKEGQNRLDSWIEKYETDKEQLQSELDQLKANRARDLERMAWLRPMIKDYTQIVKDERRIKKIAADRVKLDALKKKKATKIQAWWRGEMVRKCLGPFNPKKKEKTKGKKKGK